MFFIYLSQKDKKSNSGEMQRMVYISQNDALIALKFRILKAKQCCESSSERLQRKQIIFYASDTFFDMILTRWSTACNETEQER